MLFSDMIQEVKNIVQDDSFDDSIPGYINEAFLQASGRVNIPDLKRIAIAKTTLNQMYTSLVGIQDGFSGRLSKLIDDKIVLFPNLEEMVTWVQQRQQTVVDVGPVEGVALEGKTLWYWPTPVTKQSLTCILFSNPIVLEGDEDSPDEFPEVCHRNIGIHGAAFLCYNIIEDGIDGIKTNTQFHLTMFEKGITQLVEWIGKHRKHLITSTLNEEISTQSWMNMYARWQRVNPAY